MPRAQLKAKIPGGPAALSAQHPDDEFRILASNPTEDGLLAILEIRTSDTEALVRDLDEVSWLTSYDLLHADEQTLLIQYSLPFIPPPYRALIASENLPRFPLAIRNGWVISDITTSHERLSRFKDELDATGLTYEIMSVTQSTDPTDLLTDRQHRFMTEAIEYGYYDTPRGCSLTNLADELDVSKSTASVVLHNAEETIIKEFFAESVE
ncbi:helix-turn-helix domain-containing protein [Haladaptatus pallidirubidus]|uniref:HTH bat-type domain-containing protein n=1 Tax=Haladaptatus pallidirubidus TaxID=1008152 RepID=A0AAV3UR32_9EURY|nr:helix-turn-helix domain-containing protein [Haladaptatus pallidirubidus]